MGKGKKGLLAFLGAILLGLGLFFTKSVIVKRWTFLQHRYGTLGEFTRTVDLQAQDIPNTYYKVEGVSNIDEKEFPTAGAVVNFPLDELGRSGKAMGTLTYQLYKSKVGNKQSFKPSADPSGWREGDGSVSKTSGASDKSRASTKSAWNTIKREQDLVDKDGNKYHGWFYNRSHLIGDALGGGVSRENVITGTRFQNVGDAKAQTGGMRYSERKVEAYFKERKENSGVVYYEATPNYIGDEIVPRTVTVRFKSSDGVLDETVAVYNAVIGYEIDYTTGNFRKV